MARKATQTSPAPPRPPAAAALQRLHWDWITAAVGFLLMAWYVTEGDWKFLAGPTFLDAFYDGQAQSLMQGRIDVAPEAIGVEAFVRNGKSYGYFGPTPALFRIPLLALMPETYGQWSRCAMLFCTLIMLVSLLILLRELERQVPGLRESGTWKVLGPVLVVAATLGSTHFYICAESKIYYESIVWGGAMSFAAAVCLLRYLTRRDGRWLAAACVTAFLAFFARVSSGAGPIFALLVVDAALLLPRFPVWRPALDARARRKAVAALTGTVAATALAWGGLNYWKFGMVFTSQPLPMNVQYTPERLAAIKGELASLHNLPMTASAYFSPANIAYGRAFPFAHMVELPKEEIMARFPKAHLDRSELMAGLPVAMPALLFGAFAGTVLCFRRRETFGPFQAPLIGTIAGCGLLFIWGLLVYRYLHDMFPWLVFGSGIAAAAIATAKHRDWRRALAGLFVAGALYGVWINVAFGLIQQRVYSFTIPADKRFAFADLSRETAERGFGAVFEFLTGWRAYRPAAKFEYGNLTVDWTKLASAPDLPVVRSTGQPPYGAVYTMHIPSDGEYELAIRYASPEPRPVLLSIGGSAVGYVCAVATGGLQDVDQKWIFGGRHRLRAGNAQFQLASNKPFPEISMLRLIGTR